MVLHVEKYSLIDYKKFNVFIGQLIREDNTKNNETYDTYDNAGNILTKKTYALTAANSTPSSLKSTYNYGYSSSDWGDLLTSYTYSTTN